MKILIVEDSPAQRLLYEDMLTDLGHEVHVVSNFTDAADRLISSLVFDLALIDTELNKTEPREYGFDLAPFCQRHNTPFIGMSLANAEIQWLGCGACGFLCKPFTPEALEAAIAKVAALPRLFKP